MNLALSMDHFREFEFRRQLFRIVEDAFAPFKPGRVFFTFQESLYGPRIVVISTDHGSFPITLHIEEMLDYRDDDRVLRFVNRVHHDIRFRPRTEPEPNIILGEE